MGELNFNRRTCVSALKKLGFQLVNKRSGMHDKFVPPPETASAIHVGAPQFIMIPRHNELRCHGMIISEIRAMGGEELVRRFKELL